MLPTGVGNYGYSGSVGTEEYGLPMYYCRSGDGAFMGTGGCIDSAYNSFDALQKGQSQRYGQYALQFHDYNGDRNDDRGDQDGDGNIRGDEDDRDLLNGPWAFSFTPELYLIDPEHKKRTYFRWVIQDDPYRPSSVQPCQVHADPLTQKVTMT